MNELDPGTIMLGRVLTLVFVIACILSCIAVKLLGG